MPGKMFKFDPELSAFLEEKIREYGFEISKKKMFGHETYFLNGYMYCGANVNGIYVHSGLEAKERALKEESGVAPFEPGEGMSMREYLLLREEAYRDERRLKQWLEQSASYLMSLPPKQPKKKKK
jgi:TfoX/Sxy family transcriptional regulator of competence genes